MRLITALFTLTFIAHSFQSHPQYTYGKNWKNSNYSRKNDEAECTSRQIGNFIVCKENGDIEFTGFKTDSKVTYFPYNATCSNTTENVLGRHGVVKIPANCINGSVKENRTVTVTVQDPNIQETGHGNVVLKGVIGGLAFHEFVLTCNTIIKVNRTVIRQFHIKDNEVIYPVKNEIGGVDMRFKPSDDIDLPDVSELYVGDEFYLFLIYKGESTYRIKPQECTAYKGNDYISASKNQTLWKNTADYENHCLDKNAESYGLMDSVGFQYLNDKTVKAKLHAFRFSGSEDVTISCNIWLLPAGDNADAIKNKNVCPTAAAIPTRLATTPSKQTLAPPLPPTLKSNQTTANGRRKREFPLREHYKLAIKTLPGRRKRESTLRDSAFKTLVVRDKGIGNPASRVGPSGTIYYVISLVGITALKMM